MNKEKKMHSEPLNLDEVRSTQYWPQVHARLKQRGSKFSGLDLRPSTLLEKQQGEQGACKLTTGWKHNRKGGEKNRNWETMGRKRTQETTQGLCKGRLNIFPPARAADKQNSHLIRFLF